MNVFCCYCLLFLGLLEIFFKLKCLCYFKCVLIDEVLKFIVSGYLLLEVLFFYWCYLVIVKCVSDLLFYCLILICFDFLFIFLVFVYFESFFFSMFWFWMLSFVGNEFLGIEKIICLLVRNCLDLEVVCVNYFYLINNFEIECVFVYLL